jgi:hypothetical protein
MAIYKQPKRLIKGAVLLMILTIMFVLIIMLMATLTVVSTAQTRTYQKFEENQADFTSRSALEFFTEHMMTNNDPAYKTTRKDPYSPTNYMTMGRDIECDIRSLKSLDKDESTSSTWNASSPPHRTAAYYDTSLYSYNDNDTAALAAGMPSYTDEKLTYTVSLPTAVSPTSSKNYGKLADGNTSTITVEVLDRYFALGSDGTVATGDRSHDCLTLRVTSTATLCGVTSTTVLVYDTVFSSPTASNDFNKGTSSRGGTYSDTKIHLVGGYTVGGDMESNNNNPTGNTFIDGKLTYNGSSEQVVFEDGQGIYTLGDIELQNAPGITLKGRNAFFYTAGTFRMTNGCTLGTSTNKLNIVCKDAYITAGTIYGNLYVKGTAYLNQADIYGDVYVDGDLILGNTMSYQSGSIYVARSVDTGATGNQIIHGHIYVNHDPSKTTGYAYMADNSNPLVIDPSKKIGSGSVSDNVTVYGVQYLNTTGSAWMPTYYYDPAYQPNPLHNTVNVGDVVRYVNSSDASTGSYRQIKADPNTKEMLIEVKLPCQDGITDLRASSPTDPRILTIKIPTKESQYPMIYKTSEYTESGVIAGLKIDDILTAVKCYNKNNNKNVTNLDLFGVNTSTPVMATVDSTNRKITSDGILLPGTYQEYEIKSGITLQLKAGTYSGILYASDDNAPINIVVPASTSIDTMGFGIFSKDVYETVYKSSQKNSTIYSGDNETMMALINPQSNRCVPPNIFMYIDKDSKLTCDTIGSLGIFLSAYIYAQEADINIKNKGRPNTNYNYNNYGTQNKDVAVVGACVFDEITNAGEITIVYVPKKSSSSSASISNGNTTLSWKPSYYSNNPNYFGY